MKRTNEIDVQEFHVRAQKKYPPELLLNYIKKESNVFLLDKDLVVQAEGEGTMLIIVFNIIYGWDYTNEYSNVTLYFEPSPDNKCIYGGVYDNVTNTKLTRKLIASSDPDTLAPYIYTDSCLNKMMRKLID